MQHDRDEVLPRIYAEVASGRSLDKVLTEDEGMPSPSTFWRWHAEDEAIRDNLAEARANGVEKIMGDVIEIADTPQLGEIVTEGPDGTTTKREDMLGHRRLQIDTRLKYAQMIAPRKYGARLDLTSGGEKISLAAEIEAARKRVAEGQSSGEG